MICPPSAFTQSAVREKFLVILVWQVPVVRFAASRLVEVLTIRLQLAQHG
jgi:hypothetical protein